MIPRLSVIVVAHNMAREIPRTIRSLSPIMQRGISLDDYEIILVDNGSAEPWNENELPRERMNIRIHRVAHPTPSPVVAINQGIELSCGSLIGVWIDGARLASPGILSTALAAARLHPRPVIGTLGFHLGPDLQYRSIQAGYTQAKEDALLDSADWEKDGYRLFQISSFAGSSSDGWFMPIGESNALFLPRTLWEKLGGYEPRFQMPGGGLANLDIWRRACMLPDTEVILLLGEGTFHQVHGGIATNAARTMFPIFHEEYLAIRGEPFASPKIAPLFIGRIHPDVLPKLAWSAEHAHAHLRGE